MGGSILGFDVGESVLRQQAAYAACLDERPSSTKSKTVYSCTVLGYICNTHWTIEPRHQGETLDWIMRQTACERCRARKSKCTPSKPCRPCLQSGHECVAPGLRVPPTRQPLIIPAAVERPVMLEESSIVDLSKQLLDRDVVRQAVESVDAIPGSRPCWVNDSTTFRWRDELPYAVPSPVVLNMLSDNYFSSVNWFMMVLDELNFRARSTLALAGEYMETADRNFCFLMSLVWGLGAHYLWTNDATSSSLPISAALRSEMMSVVDVAFSRIMADPSLEAVQIAILLGSFHLFNGLPYLGFAIFGSGVRCAQAMGLHRQSRSSTSEACLVWWALEICDKYAAVAFGLPCAIDDSDCDVPEIDVRGNIARSGAAPESTSPLTYHKLKARLYRIMGPFLGRKRQTNQLRGLLQVRRELTDWLASVPDRLKCSGDGPGFNGQPLQVQWQAIALQLAYDNLQMVLFRQAVFPKNLREGHDVRHHQADGIGQLSQSATRTASISTFAASRLICRSSHAAMHVAICSFTAGVILCLMLASQPSNPEKQHGLHP
ncbi:Fungal specific transcription factor domain-containing protein isoform 2 [Cladophialophora immunda]|nr:Fungal specific transcription factor domain-containing protein isoform 1 [Cladophialophora immunda]OQU96372.1 Fungal specific transcription factor domain-containing protein isoform 2 [Cladophialophora immunda]